MVSSVNANGDVVVSADSLRIRAQGQQPTANTHEQMSAETQDLLIRARSVAADVADPELPFVTVEDLGILRAVRLEDNCIVAEVSPTYSGCTAVAVIEQSILSALLDAGFNARVQRVMSPAWTTDWITKTGRQKLLQNGIAPPVGDSAAKPVLFEKPSVTCPHCKSTATALVSEFGSTPCKAQYRCKDCQEPFDYFKCH